jgi:hypothetical protein
MIPYFQKFPNVLYTFGPQLQQVLTNVIHRARIRETIRTNTAVYYQYFVKDGETAWTIADKYYGDSRFHWVVFFSNDLIDPYFDWPMSYDDFNATMIDMFGDIPTAKSTIHHYEDGAGHVIDLTTYNSNVYVNRLIVYAYDYYFGLNEGKRGIQLLDKSFLPQIESELNALLAKTSN